MLRKALTSPWIILLGLMGIIILSYGALATKLGFYWDDWTIVWYIHFLGPTSFKEAFAFDRPLLAWIYMITSPLMGESPLNWQIFALFTRWLAVCALWWSLHGLWPRRILQTTAIAILFALYPGFKQQFIAVTYGNAFLVLALYLTSWGLMIWSLRIKAKFWPLFTGSLILASYSVFTAEHFFGLELLRPIFIWMVIRDTISNSTNKLNQIKQTLKLWLPYLVLDILFLIWRLTNPTPRAQITILDKIKTQPFDTLRDLIQTLTSDIFTSTALAWKQTIDFGWLSEQTSSVLVKFLLIAFAAGLISGVILFIHRRSYTTKSGHEGKRQWAILAIGLGFLALLFGGIPIWPTNLRIDLAFPWDRFTLPMMFGAALLIVGIIELVDFLPFQNIVFVALLAGTAAGFQYRNALTFRMDWLAQRDFFWQLTWRAPGIEPGTILLTSEMPFDYEWDNSLTAPLNWIYAPDLSGQSLPYLMYNAESRLSSGLPSLKETTQINENLRITPFNGSISQTLLGFYRPPGSCTKIIDPQIDQYLPDKPRYFRQIYEFSDPDLILTDAEPAAAPPVQFFGEEPEMDWCYFFEKAELARQEQDWKKISDLGDQAFGQGKNFFRKNAYELLPFIEGYAHTGELEKSLDLTLQAYQAWENMRTPLCSLWLNLYSTNVLDANGQAIYDKVQEYIACP